MRLTTPTPQGRALLHYPCPRPLVTPLRSRSAAARRPTLSTRSRRSKASTLKSARSKLKEIARGTMSSQNSPGGWPRTSMRYSNVASPAQRLPRPSISPLLPQKLPVLQTKTVVSPRKVLHHLTVGLTCSASVVKERTPRRTMSPWPTSHLLNSPRSTKKPRPEQERGALHLLRLLPRKTSDHSLPIQRSLLEGSTTSPSRSRFAAE